MASPERWLSGRKHRFAKSAYGFNHTTSSNLVLSACSKPGFSRSILGNPGFLFARLVHLIDLSEIDFQAMVDKQPAIRWSNLIRRAKEAASPLQRLFLGQEDPQRPSENLHARGLPGEV